MRPSQQEGACERPKLTQGALGWEPQLSLSGAPGPSRAFRPWETRDGARLGVIGEQLGTDGNVLPLGRSALRTSISHAASVSSQGRVCILGRKPPILPSAFGRDIVPVQS